VTVRRRSFGLNRKSVAASRQFVGDAVVDLPDELREAAILMMSELATNAIVHAATGFEVGIDRSVDWLRIAVTDVGGGEPELQSPSSSDPHGRGLQIVKELSDEWGMIDNDDHSGKTVWCALRLDRTGRSEGAATATSEEAGGRTDRQRSRPIPRQQKRGADRSEAVEDGQAQSWSKTGCQVRACRIVHRPCSHRVRSKAEVMLNVS
jgi:anti-sigma regulatory factor (Ser/Thr protein kinase)